MTKLTQHGSFVVLSDEGIASMSKKERLQAFRILAIMKGHAWLAPIMKAHGVDLPSRLPAEVMLALLAEDALALLAEG